MRLRVFRLREGKLELVGAREVRLDDSIIEGETSMAEVSLQEASTSDFPLYFKTTPPTEAELAAAALAVKADKEKQGEEGLANSYRQSHPGATDAEIQAFAKGRAPDPLPDTLDASLRRAHPEYIDKQIAIFKKGR